MSIRDAFKALGLILGGLALLTGGVLLVIALIHAAIEEEKAWQKYKVEHNCKVIDYRPSYQRFDGTDAKGNPRYTYVSSETIYKCDNEEIVVR